MTFPMALRLLGTLSLLWTVVACTTTLPTLPPHGQPLASDTSVSEAVARIQLETPEPGGIEGIAALPQTEAAAPAHADLWARLRNGYALPEVSHKRIDQETDWYARHPNYLDRVAERARPYLHYIVDEAERRGIPAEIALLPVVESAFKPFAYSHGRAAGIWQFIPGTGRHYGLKQNWWYDGRRDVYASTAAALEYLQQLQKNLDGDWLLALAAYNSGEGTVRKAIRRNKKKGKPTDFWSLHLPPETRGYVPRLLAIARIIKDPAAYDLELTPIADTPYFSKVDIDGQVDLALAAELADIELDELYMLNPGFNRWATAPKGPHYLLLPVDKAAGFSERFAVLPKEQRMRWAHHKVASGETLSHIADKYRISVALLKSSNKLRSNFLRTGQNLVIPIASKSAPTYRLSASQRKQRTLNAPKSGRNKITHVVVAGDTMWDIARTYKVGVRELAKWNAMAPRDTLHRGQKLVVWTKTVQRTARHVSPATPPSSKPVIQRVNYTVRRGDSLARIAARFRVRITDLMRWNTLLSKSKYLQPGQRLKLFVDVTQQSS
ncbi:lytic transglycosylase [Sulfuriflexus mobilis]|uniref:lytic transglycosylase n=1 Tax=Sulfuriflexus mobilis TaxID=1811807 RepID=UPI0018D5538A|nr:LysM peptidoglycan-binding domain-containing protein [Sulfuriflexus mobilis]